MLSPYTTQFKMLWNHSLSEIFSRLSIALCFAMLCTNTAFAKSTIFLPINVTVKQETEKYQRTLDQIFSSRLAETAIKFIDRSDATKLTNYSRTWPPTAEQLKAIAEQTNVDNIITGTLSSVGGKLSIDLKYFDILSPTSPMFFYQTASSDAKLTQAVDTLISSVEQYEKKESRIYSIVSEGNKRIDSGAILRQITTQKGDNYSQDVLREDLKKIFAMGYFQDVQIDVKESNKGKRVAFRVIENPLIKKINYIGIAGVDEEDLKAASLIKEQQILNSADLEKSKKEIINFYTGKGYYNSKVETAVNNTSNDGTIVTFRITEGEKIYIKEIRIDGNKAFNDGEILDEIKTGEYWFMSWLTEAGVLDKSKISQDTKRIAAFYADHGYLDIKVSDPVITQAKEWLYIVFNLEEGTRYKVGTIDIAGSNLDDHKAELLKLLEIRKEKYVSRKIVRSDILHITDYFAEKGYAFANIKPRFARNGNDRMDIIFDVNKEKQVRIDRIEIRGNTRTHDNVIRRELKITEGGIFDSKAMRDSIRALQRLQFFEDVNITPEPVANAPDLMKIIISVKEKSTGSFSIGAGYSSADKIIFMGQVAENNFLGRGDTVEFSANIGSSSNRFNLGYTNPRLNDSHLSFGFDLFHNEREYDDYTRKSTGGGLRLGYPLWEKWKLYSNYSLVDTNLSSVSSDASYIIRNSVDIHLTSAIKISLVRDTRNLRFGATEGSRNVFSVKYAGGPLGGDAQFTKLEATSGWYFPLFWGTAFHVKGAVGKVYENENKKLPVYERFYLGGLHSIRGFKYAKVSPIDTNTDERVGGDQMWYTNTEFLFPVFKEQGIQGLVFFDAGKVMDSKEDFKVGDDVRTAVGAGINWLSPLGPLQFVWGYNLDPVRDEDDSVLDFSIGGTF